jgi:hypothetical protein
MHPLITPREAQLAFKQGFPHFLQTGTGPIIGKVTELIALRKGGEAFPVEVSIAALQIGGTWNAIGIFRDITEPNVPKKHYGRVKSAGNSPWRGQVMGYGTGMCKPIKRSLAKAGRK